MATLDDQVDEAARAGTASARDPGAGPRDKEAFVVWKELEDWSAGLSPWQQWIVAQAVDHRTLTPPEVDAAYRLLLHESQLGTSDDAPLPSLPPVTARPTSASRERWFLKELSGFQNINAIPGTTRLPLGQRLTILYGKNGTGKSGFARLLSKACFSRAPLEILPNVYKLAEGAPGAPDALITLTGPNGDETVSVAGTPNHAALKAFTVFDTQAARVQISQDNALAFTPTGLDVFREVSRVYGALAERLKKEVEARVIPFDFVSRLGAGAETTNVAGLVAAVRESLDLTAIRAVVATASADRLELEDCRKKIADLSGASVAARRDHVRHNKQRLEQLRTRLGDLRAIVGMDARRKLQRQMVRFSECLAAAAAESAEAFKRQGVHAVGTPEWSAFIAAAGELAGAESAPGQPYPLDGAPCLLCHRPLDEPSASLLRRLWAFLRTPARRELEGLSESLDATLSKLEHARTDLVPSDSAVHAYLAEANPALLREMKSFLSSTERLRLEIAASVRERAPISDLEIKSPLESLATQVARLSEEEKALEAADPHKQVAALRMREMELQSRLALVDLVPDIERFILSERWCRMARAVIAADLNTKPVSSKERELFKKVVESLYLERLSAECIALNCKLPEFETRGQKGETLRSFKLGDYKPHRVLSEGEQRALALADFLTEVGVNPSSAGIILDDPVTSMDHDRKVAIAARLVKEAGHRQVVVFTHDLVFLDLLLRAVEREAIDCTTHWIQRSGDDEPGHVVHDDHPTSSKEYETTKPAEKALDTAKKASGSAQVVAVRDGMARLRRTLEEVVLKHLFKGTVSRWEERIKISQIKHISWSDGVADEVYELFEQLSRSVEGHSHSEAYGAPPEPAELQKMITRVQELISKARPRRSGS